MVRLVEVVLKPGKRTCPPLATPAGASRLRCVPPPRLHRGGGAGGITPLQGTPAYFKSIKLNFALMSGHLIASSPVGNHLMRSLMGALKNCPFRSPERGASQLLQCFSRPSIDKPWFFEVPLCRQSSNE